MYAKTYYRSINELPVGRWIEAQNGNLTALRKTNLGSKKKDAKIFELLLNEYIQMFGLGDQFSLIWKKEKQLADLNQEYLSDFMNKRHLLTDIEMLEREIEEIEKTVEKGNLLDVIVQLRKINNVNIDLQKDSVVFVEKLIRAN